MSPQSSSSLGRSCLAWSLAALGLPTGSRGSGTGHSPRPRAPMGFGGRGRYVLGAVNQWAATGRTEFEQRCIRERRHEKTCDGPANCSGVTRGFLTLAVGCGRIGRGLGNTRSERGQQHSECKPRRAVAMNHRFNRAGANGGNVERVRRGTRCPPAGPGCRVAPSYSRSPRHPQPCALAESSVDRLTGIVHAWRVTSDLLRDTEAMLRVNADVAVDDVEVPSPDGTLEQSAQ